MEVNYTAWRFWFDMAQFLGWLGVAFYVWLSNRHKATNGRIDTLEADVDERISSIEDRVTRTELEIKHMPNKHDLERLSGRIEELHGDLHEIAGAVSGLRRAVDLMNEYLINNGGKR